MEKRNNGYIKKNNVAMFNLWAFGAAHLHLSQIFDGPQHIVNPQSSWRVQEIKMFTCAIISYSFTEGTGRDTGRRHSRVCFAECRHISVAVYIA